MAIDSGNNDKEIRIDGSASSRPSAASAQARSRKIAIIAIGAVAAALCVAIAAFAVTGAGSSHTRPISEDAATAETAQVPANQSGADSVSPDLEPSQDGDTEQVAMPDSSDPRIQVSDSTNETVPEDRVVYLTFDDGPSNLTPSILKTLKDNDVKATWFVIGSHSNLDYLKNIWNEGHQIALHSNSHNYKKIYKSSKAFFEDLDTLSSKIQQHIGVAPTLIRFPGGSINSYNKKVYKKIFSELKARNWHYFDWNASVEDAVSPKMRSANQLVASVKKSSKGKHSVCLLMHDTDAKESTAEALDKIIKYYKQKGYEFRYLTPDSYGYHF